MLTVDDVDQFLRKKLPIIIGRVFQLTYAGYCDKLVQEEKVKRCRGCATQHFSRRHHTCLMLDSEAAWFNYHDEAPEQIDLAMVMQTVESVCGALGLKLGQTWGNYLTELPKLPWTSLYLTSLELKNYDEDMKDRVLYALYYGPCGLKTHDFSSVEIHKDDDATKVKSIFWLFHSVRYCCHKRQ